MIPSIAYDGPYWTTVIAVTPEELSQAYFEPPIEDLRPWFAEGKRWSNYLLIKTIMLSLDVFYDVAEAVSQAMTGGGRYSTFSRRVTGFGLDLADTKVHRPVLGVMQREFNSFGRLLQYNRRGELKKTFDGFIFQTLSWSDGRINQLFLSWEGPNVLIFDKEPFVIGFSAVLLSAENFSDFEDWISKFDELGAWLGGGKYRVDLKIDNLIFEDILITKTSYNKSADNPSLVSVSGQFYCKRIRKLEIRVAMEEFNLKLANLVREGLGYLVPPKFEIVPGPGDWMDSVSSILNKVKESLNKMKRFTNSLIKAAEWTLFGRRFGAVWDPWSQAHAPLQTSLAVSERDKPLDWLEDFDFTVSMAALRQGFALGKALHNFMWINKYYATKDSSSNTTWLYDYAMFLSDNPLIGKSLSIMASLGAGALAATGGITDWINADKAVGDWLVENLGVRKLFSTAKAKEYPTFTIPKRGEGVFSSDVGFSWNISAGDRFKLTIHSTTRSLQPVMQKVG